MVCQDIEKLMPAFLEDALELSQCQLVKEHLSICTDCQTERALYEQSWDMLKRWPDIQPSPRYISDFWTRFSLETPWYEEILFALKRPVLYKRFAPALVVFSVVLIVGFLSSRNYFQMQQVDRMLAALAPEEAEMVENIELVQNLDVIEDIDILEDLESLEDIEALES